MSNLFGLTTPHIPPTMSCFLFFYLHLAPLLWSSLCLLTFFYLWHLSAHLAPAISHLWASFFCFCFFFIVHRKRIHRARIRHNLIQATHCYVNTYHNGYTIHVLPYFLVHTYIYTHTYIHTHMYRHWHVSTFTYTHIYIFKPGVFF